MHVNGDYPEAVVAVVGFATEFLLHFGKDVIVDLFCYRRYGHNEADEPMFTQPLMYQRIAETQPVREEYARHLREEGTIAAGEADAMVEQWQTRLEKEFELSKQHSVDRADWLEGTWSGLEPVKGYDARRGKTARRPRHAARGGARDHGDSRGLRGAPQARRSCSRRRRRRSRAAKGSTGRPPRRSRSGRS